jgi:porin
MKRTFATLGLIAATSLIVSGQETSGTNAPSLRRWATQDYMLGDWGGVRSDLSRRGLDFEFIYGASSPNCLDGGLRQGAIYQGALLMSLDADSAKLAGYPGGTLHASGVWMHGQKPFSDAYVGDLNKVNLLDYNNAARLWELWYQQRFLEGKLSFKFGELSIDRDFIAPEYFNTIGQFTLINQTFFYPTLPFDVWDIRGLPVRHHGLATTPLSTPGAILRWAPADVLYLQAGVYGGNPDQSYSGTEFNLSREEGALAYFETGYRLNPGTNQPGLSGSYKFGGYYHTGDFADVNQGVLWAFANQAGLPAPKVANHHGNYGGYLLAEQQLYNELGKSDPAQQGLLAFFRLLGAPSDRNLAQMEIDGGLVYRGLIPGRDWDSLALGASYLQISDDIRRAQRTVNLLAPGAMVVSDHEIALELSYKVQATAWWTLQPSLQRVLHPGGSSAIPDATVLILQSTFRF